MQGVEDKVPPSTGTETSHGIAIAGRTCGASFSDGWSSFLGEAVSLQALKNRQILMLAFRGLLGSEEALAELSEEAHTAVISSYLQTEADVIMSF